MAAAASSVLTAPANALRLRGGGVSGDPSASPSASTSSSLSPTPSPSSLLTPTTPATNAEGAYELILYFAARTMLLLVLLAMMGGLWRRRRTRYPRRPLLPPSAYEPLVQPAASPGPRSVANVRFVELDPDSPEAQCAICAEGSCLMAELGCAPSHSVCARCLERISACPFCRKEIT